MTSTSDKSYRVLKSSSSLIHLAGTTLILGALSFGAMLLNATSWGVGSISILWPSTGLLIGILLGLPRRQWPKYLALGFVIDTLVNQLIPQGMPLPASLYLAGCNSLEVYLAAWLLCPAFCSDRELTRSGQLFRLITYGAIVAPAVASLFASFYMRGKFGKPTFDNFEQWFTGDALGDAIVIPLSLGFRKRLPFSTRSWVEVFLLFSLLIVVSGLVFWQTSLPLLYVILPFLLLVEVRLGLAGSAIGLLAVSVIGGYFTAQGHGPVALTRFVMLSSRTLTLQAFIFVCLIVVYIVEVVLADRNRFESNLRASEQRFRLLAEGTHDLILLRDLQGGALYVSPAVTTLLGWQPEEFAQLGDSRLIHPEDLTNLVSLYQQCLAGEKFNTLDFRCLKRAGGYLWMQCNLVLHRNLESGSASSFINVIRDISAQKAAEEEMHRALSVAVSLAGIDALTNIANRRSFDEYLKSEWSRAIRASTPTSILLIDVDNFKRYNDMYGHIPGDTCLRAVARAVASCTNRAVDLVARYGGEEFAAVLPNTDAHGAQVIAEQIRAAVEQQHIAHEGNPLGVVTVSVGAASQTPALGSSATQLIQCADSALYKAKESGRNRVMANTKCHELGSVANFWTGV